MAASVSTKLKTIGSASAVSEVMNLLVDKIEDDQREKLSHWIKLIEEHAEKIVHALTPAQLKRRKPEVVAAAAVYDAFLEFESRTTIKLRLPMMQEALSQSPCTINTTWNRLFDNRASLMGDYLDRVYIEKNGLLPDAVSSVIQALTKAVYEMTAEVKKWLEKIEIEAIELAQSLKPDSRDHLLIAVTVVYAAIQQHHGKMMVRISQRDLSLLSTSSPAMISKCWLKLFES
jgi:hypothetical protein